MPIINLNWYIKNNNCKLPNNLTHKQFDPYLVGLIDAAGNIIVNKNNNSNELKFSLIVKIPNKPINKDILTKIINMYGGYIIYNVKHITWIVNNKNTLQNIIIPLLYRYPLITNRMRIQYKSFITSFNSYYDNSNLMNNTNYSYNTDYFTYWLAGFIECNGYFNIKNNIMTFNIQNEDIELIWQIKNYYKIDTIPITCYMSNFKATNPIYIINTNNQEYIIRIIIHSISIIQGYKYYQVLKYIKKL